MKKVIFLFALPLALISCTSDNQFQLQGTAEGIADGQKVILSKQDSKLGAIPVDTAEISNGKFEFKGKASEPTLYYLEIDGVRGKSFVILDDADINIEVFKDSVLANRVSGTYHNEELTAFNLRGLKIQKKLVDFEKANLARRDQIMANKDMAAMKALQDEHSAIRLEVEEALQKESDTYIESHPESFVSVLLVDDYLRRFAKNPEKIQNAFNSLSKEMKQTKLAGSILRKLEELKTVNVGRKAPDFTAKTPTGQSVSLAESLGRATIIDFWASWCGPCRRANPEVVALYNEFHHKGLNIIGVSLDAPGNKDKWIKAIKDDGLQWTQVSNLMHWDDPIAKMYGVEAIPALFVLNQYGVVVAKDIHGDELRKKISEMLK